MSALPSEAPRVGRDFSGLLLFTSEVDRRDTAVIRFAAVQLFSTIYLQKIALGTMSFQVRVPLILMAAGLAWAAITGVVSFSPGRCGIYMVFVGCSLVSVIFSGFVGSIPSVIQLWLMYVFFTLSFRTRPEVMSRVMALFVYMMVVPSMIVIFQYSFQKMTGRPDPLNMNAMLPKQVLLQHYFYNEHYPVWYSSFTRPNGFFFLEPSFISQYAALAAIVEVLYFRRLFFFVFFVIAVIMSTGATGIVTLIVASPFLLAREAPRTIITILVVGSIGLSAGYAANQLPFLSRVGKSGQDASAAQRMLLPAAKMVEFGLDPSFLVTGVGPGQTSPGELGNGWAIVKLVYEYGLVTACAYMALFVAALAANGEALPLKAAIFFVFHFTGGYLFDVNAINFLAITCLFSFPRAVPLPGTTIEHRSP